MTVRTESAATPQAPDPVAVRALERAFRGELLRPGDVGYDERRRVWNGSVDRHPSLIARCTSVADVVAALAFTRRTGLPLAVRSGGHSFPGLSVCDDGIVIDLRRMHEVRVDPGAGTVSAEAGVLLGELDAATQAHGMAVPVGSVTHTGLAGLTLGGGFGWLMRKHGLAIDQLVAAEVVTADGGVIRASATEHPDLFWGLRGGGGNFGIVTRLDYRLHEVGPMVLAGLLMWPLADAPQVARFHRDWAAAAPDELTTALVLRRAPAIDLVPPALHGQPVVAVACCWIGPLDRGETVLAPLRRLGSRGVDLVAARAFVDHQAMFDAGFPPGIWAYSKATDVVSLDDDVLDILVGHAERMTSDRSGMVAWQLGGAVARVGEAETPFGSRASGFLVDILGASDGVAGFARERDWARACWTALAPHRAGVYVNWLMEEGDERVREAYGAERYARLRVVKRRYDPENIFQLNQNIPPA